MDARGRHAQHQAKRIARAIRDRYPDTVLNVDAALHIAYLNATAARFLGPRDDGWGDDDGAPEDAWLGEDLAHAAKLIANSGIAAACRRGPRCAPNLVGRATPCDDGLIVIMHDATHDLLAPPPGRALLLDRLVLQRGNRCARMAGRAA